MTNRFSLRVISFALLSLLTIPGAEGAQDTIHVDTPMTPPAWALMERELLDASTTACIEFFDRYFDKRGYLECVERWGGDDGPDDAIENINDWPVLHALGAPNVIREMIERAWEGHVHQFTNAKTVDVPFARDGMYYKEFPVMFDWVHNGEGLTVFNLMGLSDPKTHLFQQRVRRFASFYTGEDSHAPNYDPKHKIIRSMFNGSRGPLMRPATGLDWAGDPIEIEGRFRPLHGEDTYAMMVEHFKDYNDIVGDHPQNMSATTLGVNAYMLSHEKKYRDWVLEYVDAWRERTIANDGIIPTKIGLDGKIGGEDGKWWGSVYGWGFTVVVPQSGALANRNTHYIGLGGFANALMLTGDQKYVDVWRRQIDAINAHGKVIDGRLQYPSMHGDDGWYSYGPNKYASGMLPIYYWSMDRDDLKRLPLTGWLAYLEGKSPGYPEAALAKDFETIRKKIEAMRADRTTRDTRLSDDPMEYNPAAVSNLVNLMLGGLHRIFPGALLHCRLRYFDPDGRRAGVPDDVAALVEKLTDDETTLTLVNVNQVEPRTVIVQGGAYGEHQCVSVQVNGQNIVVNDAFFPVRLEPGTGQKLVIKMKRYANQPTLAHPWDRNWWLKN
ncbi:MAG: hypothetical protein CMJ81_08305 [Planctomycetaceae bacterium]|nr:hypothetical protein [Planctomycetaceae bacterium]